MLPLLVAGALADAPRSATLLAEGGPGGGSSEATPVVEVAPGDGDGRPAPATLDRRAGSDLAPDGHRPTLDEVAPGRVTWGLLAGSAAVLVAPVLTVAGLLALPGMEGALATGRLNAELVAVVVAPLLSAWVMGPLVAGLVMGAGPVWEKALLYALAGALFGILSVAVPAAGVLALFAGPMVGTVLAVAESPAELFNLQARAPSAPPSSLLCLSF